VTGASSGIGMETALAFAKAGYAVVLAARREKRLEEVAEACRKENPDIDTLVRRTDVTDPQQVDALVAAAVDRFGRIDVMVNNAGYGHFGAVHELGVDDMRAIFDVNYFGVFYGCKAVAPVMMAQRSGHIFNMSSLMGKFGAPFHGAYCATKYAICGLSDSLRIELRPYNIRVTSVCPALTQSEFPQHLRNAPARSASRIFGRLKRKPAGPVARKIVKSTGKYKPNLIFTAGGRFICLTAALWPGLMDKLLMYFRNDMAKSIEAASDQSQGD
jgi:short-subunit dehydrogenase